MRFNAKCQFRVFSSSSDMREQLQDQATPRAMNAISIERLPNGHVQLFARPTWTLTILASALSAVLIGLFAVSIWLAVAFQFAFVLISPLALALELVVIYAVCFRDRYLLITERLIVIGLAEYDTEHVLGVDIDKGALLFRFDNRGVSFFRGLPKDELLVARDTIRDALYLEEKRRSS